MQHENDEVLNLEEKRIEEVANIKVERFNRIYFPEEFPVVHHDDEIEDGD